ncbi:26s proteasome regulatory subunit 6a [Anaeramoeba flamelloides]|uniref:26s proteasome regulatory subunit 6a n=1 Tax=Anaeramoeba flamelloides TaxID=1746091 RepID=A0AAV7Z237_9EUKA|nr:26s proteasome regulatory subunit 6a [Anaeramoeba flamelloides]KAJ3430019.1 26s proteasome regulatory subunit 6a [Anaeramoeba flamelloides]KAJ3434685.1 26s proteasome regulatory subunit 6a [Anaeramoeba flamelloides]KAJ6239158.1 26s proteasome regulatory subunit 6a [Anaeramoeba flamelloides]
MSQDPKKNLPKSLEELEKENVNENELSEEILSMTNEELKSQIKVLDLNIRNLRSERTRLDSKIKKHQENIDDNTKKIDMRKKLPYLVSSVVELIDPKEVLESKKKEKKEEEYGFTDLASGEEMSVVIKTTTRQTIYLPVIGLVDPFKLHPGDLVGVNKDSYLILDLLPREYDTRVKAMELDEKPKETYNDIGGLDKQIRELMEAVVYPLTEKEKFQKIGIRPPKGCLLYGAPGTGKTLLARACAGQTQATFLKLAGPQLVQMYIGDGAKLVRDAFELAKEKAPTIIFIDELDAIGTKRFASERHGDREVQRTMLELLNQLDGFTSNDDIKVIAATNRVDILDPALLRSGRLDRKIEFPLPDESARKQILSIHSKKMTVSESVNFDELSRCTRDFNGAMLKSVCVEAGMNALNRDAMEIEHEDFMQGIDNVKAKKTKSLIYYA